MYLEKIKYYNMPDGDTKPPVHPKPPEEEEEEEEEGGA